MAHAESHPKAGRVVKIKQNVTHPQVSDFGGSEYRVEDWWDRVAGEQKSWITLAEQGHPAAIIYGIRVAANSDIPEDNEVLYGKVGAFGHMVHVTEIE